MGPGSVAPESSLHSLRASERFRPGPPLGGAGLTAASKRVPLTPSHTTRSTEPIADSTTEGENNAGDESCTAHFRAS